MRRSLLALALATGVGAVLATAGAASAQADGTPVTFTVSGGGISITQPTTTAALGTAASALLGTSVSGSLGSTTVTDLRGSLAGWNATVTGPSAGFVDGATPTPDTVPDSAATVWVPSVTVSGTAVRTDLHVTQLTGLGLTSSPQALVTMTTVGSNTVTYNPSIAVTLPASTIAGTYTGTITQTVS